MSASSASAASASAVNASLRLRDETFDTTALGAYNLYLLASPTRLQLAVADVERNKFVALEEHPLPTGGLPALAAQHDCLGQRGWNAVRLAITGRAFTLLPAPLFRAGDEEATLRLHHFLTPFETVRHTAHPGLELVNVFAADAALASWLSTTHGASGRLLHHTSALLAGLVHQRGAASPRRLYLNPGPQELTLVVLGQSLEYCNVFPCSTAEDVVYYTILVMQELGLNPDEDEVTVWGELTPDSAIFSLLRTYVRQVRFGPRPGNVQYSYRLNDVFEYRYFDLFSLHFA
ncbi:DUF3822 family protein [Hymenobacter properus]|uniref:DUF3822 family protein n=1 Tax=Hymenobacter properus TaxID=2791026 RepID=A0A931FNE6_9BACT|nr:DUF3822 family protein [Hymenobacter properus]MBF9144061.1 DUF3822 family protein [Hymenobacter properus]MBR7722877.1 DUF3822 family protein [Microvirga sp. SRT04]